MTKIISECFHIQDIPVVTFFKEGIKRYPLVCASLEEKDVFDFVRAADPFNQIKNFSPRALLMMNGSRDEEVPAEYAQALYEKLAENYEGCTDRLEISVEDQPHFVSVQMEDKAVAWFEKFLLL